MKIQRRLFDQVLVLEAEERTDCRGSMAAFSPADINQMIPGLIIREQRVYTMPEAHTFFGIHYQGAPFPQAKIISVVHGSGLDYVVDLRKGSRTRGKWKCLELKADLPCAVFIPAGFGHAFLSAEKDTVQLFAADKPFVKGCSGSIHYKDPDICLRLPCEDIVLSEQDQHAPYLRDVSISF